MSKREKTTVPGRITIILAAFAFMAATASANTIITYNINFTTTSGSPAPASGSFTYDSTNPLFSNFLVTWDNQIYDLTSVANSPTIISGGQYTPCPDASPTPALGFAIMSQNFAGCYAQDIVFSGNQTVSGGTFGFYTNITACNPGCGYDEIGRSVASASGPVAAASGGWTITAATASPEPSTYLYSLLGCVGLIVLRKRGCPNRR